jgi:hypothetical protein
MVTFYTLLHVACLRRLLHLSGEETGRETLIASLSSSNLRCIGRVPATYRIPLNEMTIRATSSSWLPYRSLVGRGRAFWRPLGSFLNRELNAA